MSKRIGIFHPTDPVGHVPGGIDTFIRGILRWAPPDLEYRLIGATSDPVARPVGVMHHELEDGRSLAYLPVVVADADGRRQRVPLTVRYLAGLRKAQHKGLLDELGVLDFHRVETALAFHGDARPRNMFLHQDMSILRDASCDIGWRHAPWLYELLERRAFSRLERVYAVRESAVQRYRRTYPAWAEKFSFVPTWVEPDLFTAPAADARAATRAALAARLGLSAAESWLVSVGRFDRQKDPLLLLDALREIPAERRPSLIMVGDGNLRREVEKRIEALQLSRWVRLTGALPRRQIAEVLQAADQFVLTSAYEGMPIVVLEALACGVPVVTTDVGEVRRVVVSGVNGIVTTDRSATRIAAAIGEALQGRARMAGIPCTEAAAAFTPQTVLGRIYDNHRAQLAGR